MLRRLKESTFSKFAPAREAKVPTYPSDHKPFTIVEKPGSSCSNCKFLYEGANCKSPDFAKFFGTNSLIKALRMSGQLGPNDKAPKLNEICSDWWRGRPSSKSNGKVS